MSEAGGCSHASLVAAALLGAAAAGLGYLAYTTVKKQESATSKGRVTTPAETDSSDSFPEYLSDAIQLHYGSQAMKELLTDLGLVFGSDMAADCTQMAERNCEALQNFTGEQGEATALDLGCSVGGTTFELRQVFPIVVGVDPDAIRIDLAKHVARKQTWVHRGHMLETDKLLDEKVFEDISDPPIFMTAEPCTFLDSVRTPFDAVLCAQFLERCERPRAVLEKLHKAIKPGGIVVIAFEWFWDAGVFPQQSVEHIGEQPSGLDVLVKEVLDRHFKFVEEHMLAMITNRQTGDFRLQLSRAVIWRRQP